MSRAHPELGKGEGASRFRGVVAPEATGAALWVVLWVSIFTSWQSLTRYGM